MIPSHVFFSLSCKTIRFIAATVLFTIGVFQSTAVEPATSPASENLQINYADNITLRADISESDLKTKGEVSFPVYVINTMNAPLPGVSLDVLSDQFEVKVSPSPAWKTFPELAKQNLSAKEYFTVTLKKKSAAPGLPCDIVLKLYSTQAKGKQLIAFLPLMETLDSHEVPLVSSFTFDGTTNPKKWGNSFSIHDLMSYEQSPTGTSQRKDVSRTRVQLVADKEYLYLLVTFFQVMVDGTIEIDVATSMDDKPVSIVLNRKDGAIRSSLPSECIEFKKCLDDPLMILDEKDPFKGPPADTYEGRISRKALGISPGNVFFINVIYNKQYFWRGNQTSSANSVIFGRMMIVGTP